MSNKNPTQDQLLALWNIAVEFIEQQQLSCAEATVNDRVYENCPDLVYNMCELVGYIGTDEE